KPIKYDNVTVPSEEAVRAVEGTVADVLRPKSSNGNIARLKVPLECREDPPLRMNVFRQRKPAEPVTYSEFAVLRYFEMTGDAKGTCELCGVNQEQLDAILAKHGLKPSSPDGKDGAA
ncbi:hypothetical protein, partial [Henriciella pelagia]|uniref:hypothetical protein n=1 Tax=Henriciella pelagia TaxID=1977912 RepID=UPI00351964EE